MNSSNAALGSVSVGSISMAPPFIHVFDQAKSVGIMHEGGKRCESRQPFGECHRACARAAAAMRRGEGLVQIDVHGVDAEIPRLHAADNGVEIRAVAVEIG